MLVASGSYTGNGGSSRNIDTGLGAQVRCVIVKKTAGASGQEACILIQGMSQPRTFTGNSPGTSAITALNANGTFTVGSSDYVNTAGATYTFIALSDADGVGDITFGTYTGDGTTSRTISCTLTPVFVMVVADAVGSVAKFKIPPMGGSNSVGLNTGTLVSNAITALGTGNFSVGANVTTNGSGTFYAWFAIAANPKFASGSYSGNGVDDRDIATGLGSILGAIVKPNAATAAQMRNTTFADDSSVLISTALPASNAIERFKSGGLLETGTDSSVNASSTTYYWFAFGKLLTALFMEDDVELVKHRGATSQIVQVYIRNSSTGAGLSGLAYNTSGLTAYYSYNGDSASHAISLVTMSLGTFTSGGFKEIDATNMPGVYQFGIPDAALANGGGVDLVLQGAANMLECRIKMQLTVSDLWDVDFIQAIFDKATSALTTAGSIGKLLVDNINATISSRLATSGYTAPPTASQNAVAVVDQALSGHTTAGTVGSALTSASDPLLTAVPGSYASGTAGWYLGQLGAIRDKTLLITADNVHFSTPTDPITGDLTLVRGDDYTVTSGRALPEWSSDDWSPFSLTTAQGVTFKAQIYPGATIFSTAATVLSDTQVRVELTAAQTGGLTPGSKARLFQIDAVLASGDVVTLAYGKITMIENVQ